MKQILLIILAVLYALWPYDLLPDLIPGWGWIDDAALIYLAWYLYRRWRQTGQTGAAGDGGARSSRAKPNSGAGEKDPYETLGVSGGDSPEEITRAYRRLAAQYHPDKVQHLGEEFQQLAEKRFKEIQAAYDALKKRGKV
jgi:DnaJ-domain-containing protein 1